MEVYKRMTAFLLCAAMLAVLFPCAAPVVCSADAEQASDAGNASFVRLQSGNMPGFYVRDISNTGPLPDFNTVKLVQNAREDSAQWRLVQGLAGDNSALVSFESVNFPGYYLKQSDTDSRKLVLGELAAASNPADFNRKATFVRETGLVEKAGAETCSFSLLDSQPKAYIRHQNFVVYLDAHGDNEGTKKDATFYIRGEETGNVQIEAAWYSTNYFLRHMGIPLEQANQIKIATWDGRYDTDWEEKGQWKIVPGLADSGENYVSFESKTHPGCYLKKSEYGDFAAVSSLSDAYDQEQFKRNATFLREPALIAPPDELELTDSVWNSYSVYGSEPKQYLRHSNYVLYVRQINMQNEGDMRTAIFSENTDNRVVIAKDSSADVESIVMTDEDGNAITPGPGARFAAGTKLYVHVTPKEGYMVSKIEVLCESEVADRGFQDIINHGWLTMPHTDTAVRILTEKFVPQPEAFTHPGIAVNRQWLDEMKARVNAGDKIWVDEFNTMRAQGDASKTPRILWNENFYDMIYLSGHLHQMVFDSNVCYVQTLMWYITGEEVYRKNALEIIDKYSRTNSIRVYIDDDRIRISLAVTKICMAAEILRYSEFNGSKELEWTEQRTEDFTRYLLLMQPRYDRYWHYMNQQNFCCTATAAAAIFRNDLDLYNKAIQRATTNPEACPKGALCDRNNVGRDKCVEHARSGDIISQIREVTVNQATLEPVNPPNIQLVELGRDIGHAYCDIGSLAYMAFTALAQGTKVNNDPTSEEYGKVSDADDAVGLFEFADHRLLKGANYIVKYTLGYDTTYIPAFVGKDKWGGDTIFKQVSDERGGPQNEYWNRFDTAYTGIYNYYRYFAEGKEAVASGAVQPEDLEYLTQAFIRLYPEYLHAQEFIGLGSLLFSYADGSDYDVIVENEYPALQNATVNTAQPDEIYQDDGYLYTGGSYRTYLQFDLSQIDAAELGELTALGLEVRHGSNEPGEQVWVETRLYTGDWEQSTASYRSLQAALTEIEDVTPPKEMYLRNSFASRHLLQDVIPELKAKGYETVTFCLQQAGAEGAEQTQRADCAKTLSASGTDNRHARPRLTTHKLVLSSEAPPSDESAYDTPGNRLMTKKTNYKDFGYVVSEDNREEFNAFRLTKINGTEDDVLLGYTPTNNTVIHYLGEGDLTDLKKIYYWVGHDRERDVTLYYTRADDDCLKTERLDFALNEGVAAESIAVKRYYASRTDMNAFITAMSDNVLAAGKTTNNRWNCNTRYELTLADNVPEGRYKVFMVTTSGDHAYVQFEYEAKWDVQFDKASKTARVSVADDGELLVYAAVYAKEDGRLKDVAMKKLYAQKETGVYSVDFSDLDISPSEDEIEVFLWDTELKPKTGTAERIPS